MTVTPPRAVWRTLQAALPAFESGPHTSEAVGPQLREFGALAALQTRPRLSGGTLPAKLTIPLYGGLNVRQVSPTSAWLPRMVMLVSEFHPDSCVVAEVRASPNHGERKIAGAPDMLVLHYTGVLENKEALAKLCSPNSEVSAHYLVLEDGHIVQCVPEAKRAWHAGVSSWAGETDINSCSIGIEIANPGHEYLYPAFPKRQIAAVTALCRAIQTRYRI